MTTSIRILKSLPKLSKLNYDNKYIISHTIFNNYKYNFLCWKSKCLYNIYFDDYSYNTNVFALDFNINKDMLKIKHLSINNDENKLTEKETKEVKKFVFDLIKNIAIEKNVNKVVIDDFHSNSKRYKSIITNHDVKCYINPYWIQAEKALI
jgi:hypothetical protein